LISRLNHDR